MTSAEVTAYSYLALGDSYTIGEGVLISESFPYQLVQSLRREGISFYSPELVAKTGWTTDELGDAMDHYRFLTVYDFVTLLVGVNNQYRGRSVENYSREFEILLNRAIHLSGDRAEHVLVISIPDWSATPFAMTKFPGEKSRDRERVSEEIDDYNRVNRKISESLGVHYLDITPSSREATENSSLIASDGLHPSGLEYQRWAQKLKSIILNILGKTIPGHG